jgi:hypothetical protein
VVTNKHKATEINIKLFEPEWDSTGMAKAMVMEPGMTIEKDPYVYNDSEDDVYIRMKLVIKIPDSTASDGYRVIDPTTISNSTTDSGDTSGADSTSSIKLTDSQIYDIIINSIYCNIGEKNVKLAEADENGSYVSNHPKYVLEGGWFYYKYNSTDSSATELTYIKVASKSNTDTLFDYITIPVLKSEYIGVFDSGLQIEVIAQAVSATSFTTEAAIKQAFEKDFTQVTSTSTDN